MKHFLIWLLEPAHRLFTRWMFRSGMALACSDAPNTDGMNRAAEQSAQLSADALAWYREEYAKTQPQRDAAVAQAAKVSDAQLQGMEFATQQARELDARNKTVFQPLEDKLVADAQAFDTVGADRKLTSKAA